MRVVIAITGASGAIYGLRTLEYLRSRPDVETHLVLSRWARNTLEYETGITVDKIVPLADYYYTEDDMTAPIASGSFRHDGMMVIPCSMKTLASIASGMCDGLIARAADVTIKEGRRLLLATRETPLSSIHIKNMLKLSYTGVTIMPPVPNFYSMPQSIDEIVNAFVGRALAVMGIENDLYASWKGEQG